MIRSLFCVLTTISIYFFGLLNAETIFIGIAGGTGSGKTTLANKISEEFSETAILIEQDNYYLDLSHLSAEEQSLHNYDHPKSIDFDLLKQHLIALKNGDSIQKPSYDFKSHTRNDSYEVVEPARIVIVDGILLFAIPQVRELFDLKIYVDTDSDIRLLRRLERDIQERGRTLESVREQYLMTVKPMHTEFVEPSKYHADIIVPGGSNTSVALNLIISTLNQHVQTPPK